MDKAIFNCLCGNRIDVVSSSFSCKKCNREYEKKYYIENGEYNYFLILKKEKK